MPKEPPFCAWRDSIQVNLLARDQDGPARADMVLGLTFQADRWLPAVLDEALDDPRWCHAK